jgi:predicted DNA repair protein MutK
MNIPKGWKLVPEQPTMDMREAGRAVHQAQEQEAMGGKIRMRFDLVTEIYQAMLAASPDAALEKGSE